MTKGTECHGSSLKTTSSSGIDIPARRPFNLSRDKVYPKDVY